MTDDDRTGHRDHHGYTEGRVGGRGGLPVIAWHCHQCAVGGFDDPDEPPGDDR